VEKRRRSLGLVPATVRAGTDSLLIQKDTCDSTTTMMSGM